MEDEIVFRAGDIEITKTLARFGSTTYPINGIGSVHIEKGNLLGPIAVSAVLLFFGLAEGWPKETWQWVCAALGVLIGLAAFNWPAKLMLRTASGDQQALESVDMAHLQTVKNAIERAVTMRG
jgi:hypothetical protein